MTPPPLSSIGLRSLVSVMMIHACVSGCVQTPREAVHARSLVLITIDTLRADHLGAYGYGRARTPALDALARTGVVFERAYAAAPITLPSHATLLTGRYPPGHGARDNGMAMRPVPTLATELQAHGFKTAAFVAAFPLDHQFGLSRGFDVYDDRLGRTANGKPADERPASQVADEAIAWMRATGDTSRMFVWIHFFEPHAPYGTEPSRSAVERYDDDISVADRAVGRIANAVGSRADTAIVVAADHGEAFGEHGEYAHSVFVYDTTLRVPLIVSGLGVHRSIADRVTLADVAPTAMRLLGFTMADVDGIDLSPALAGGALPPRSLYAESFAPLIEFGWAPLRAIRSDQWKFIAAPKPELFDIDADLSEQHNVVAAQPAIAASLADRAGRYSSDEVPSMAAIDPAARERLRALGYSAGSAARSEATRPDPKDRRELAARIAQAASGELQGSALREALEAIVHDDPHNSQAHLRLGHALLEIGDCTRAESEFHAAAASGLPSADIHLGLATCLGRRGDLAGAERALMEAGRLEPDNPVIAANVGILLAQKGDLPGAINSLNAALAVDPDLHQARFNLAIAYARAGRRMEAAATTRELLARLPGDAPQRPEVERLLKSLQ